MGLIYCVGIGPGRAEGMTMDAVASIASSDVLCGYRTYLDLIPKLWKKNKDLISSGMMEEKERAKTAVLRAEEGRDVTVVCSGDSGVYGMAGLLIELLDAKETDSSVDVIVIPGVTAAISGAALLGAPLMNDFCVISLSDHLTPAERIEKRLLAAAEGDFVIVLYNPMSKHRPNHLKRACELLMKKKSPDTVCGWVKNIGRKGQEKRITDLKTLADEKLDMTTTVYIGASDTVMMGKHMVTPRGYSI